MARPKDKLRRASRKPEKAWIPAPRLREDKLRGNDTWIGRDKNQEGLQMQRFLREWDYWNLLRMP